MKFELNLKIKSNLNLIKLESDLNETRLKLELNLRDFVELGQFNLENSANDVFVLQNGRYRFDGIWKQS